MYIRIIAKPNSSANKIEKVSEGVFEVSVKEPPENNLANLRILALLRGVYPNRPIKIIKGHHTTKKLIEIGE